MIESQGPVVQALLGTLFTWFLTFLGASTAVFLQGNQRKLLDTSLGFAAGVMLAASYWSLLEPALEMAAGLGTYGEQGEWAFLPVSVGFLLGAGFVYLADLTMSSGTSPLDIIVGESKKVDKEPGDVRLYLNQSDGEFTSGIGDESLVRQRKGEVGGQEWDRIEMVEDKQLDSVKKDGQWRRILLLIVAVTVHNIPEGLAVGVAFGAIGRTKSATFETARNLALGIGIQNFPEGVAVSLPLKAAGFSTASAIWYGQLSGLVEPISGVLGAALVTLIVPVLPYALAFAAGAMVYVVVDDIVPEAHSEGNGKLASWGAIVGFVVMMSMDVALG